jgi:hypothetical protein
MRWGSMMKVNDLLDDNSIDRDGCLRYLTKICGSDVTEGEVKPNCFIASVTSAQFIHSAAMMFRSEGTPRISQGSSTRSVQYVWRINGGTLTFDHISRFRAAPCCTITISVKKP